MHIGPARRRALCTLHPVDYDVAMAEAEVIRRILRELDWNDLAPPPLDDQAQLVQSSLGDGVLRWIAGTVEQGCTEINQGEDADPLAPWSRVRVLAHGIAISFVLDLLEVPQPTPDTRRELERSFAEDIVSRDIDIASVVSALRKLQDLWLGLLVQAAVAASGGAAAVPRLANAVPAAVDRALDVLLTAVAEERRLVLRSGRARVRTMIEALISGQLPDERAASHTLGLPLNGWHLGCVLHAPAGATLSRSEVDTAVGGIAGATGGRPLLRHETSTGQVWLWASSEHPLDPIPAGALSAQHPIVVGIGEPRQGLTGFRRTHDEAIEALRVGLMLVPRAQGYRYRDVGLAALLSQDLERARWFVDSELGDLAADTTDMRELRRTLRAYFGAQMRVAPAADALYIHRNSLRDRLRRIEQLLGYRIADRPAECQAALRLSEFIGLPG